MPLISYGLEGFLHLFQHYGTENMTQQLKDFRTPINRLYRFIVCEKSCDGLFANLSGSTLSAKPYIGLFGSSGESQESFSAESLSPAAEIWVIKIALVDHGINWPGDRIRSTSSSTEFNTTITDMCLYESTHSTIPSFGKPWGKKHYEIFSYYVN